MKFIITILSILFTLHFFSSCYPAANNDVYPPPFDSARYADSMAHIYDSLAGFVYGSYEGGGQMHAWKNGADSVSSFSTEFTVTKLPGDSLRISGNEASYYDGGHYAWTTARFRRNSSHHYYYGEGPNNVMHYNADIKGDSLFITVNERNVGSLDYIETHFYGKKK